MARVLIDAHRGSRHGFRRAFEADYDYVEFDVRRSRRGRLVIQHDPDPPEDALSLDALLEMAAGSTSRLHVDLKEPRTESEIVRTLYARGFGPERFVVTGADAGILAVKNEFPEVRTGLSLGDDLKAARVGRRLRVRLSELFPARRLRGSRADFVAVEHRLATLNVLRYCARAGVPAWVWTVDEVPQINRFLADPRVAVLITNSPHVARTIRDGTTLRP